MTPKKVNIMATNENPKFCPNFEVCLKNKNSMPTEPDYNKQENSINLPNLYVN